MLRIPPKGSYLANITQGGSTQEIALHRIPKSVLNITKKIQKIINKKFNKPLFSIDFGIENEIPYVFELNGIITIPRDRMKSAKPFMDAVLQSLKRLSK